MIGSVRGTNDAMRILLWHVHGSWTTAFVQGRHDYLLPVNAERDEDGPGRARTWQWPENVREVPVQDLERTPVDVVLLQRPRELDLTRQWLGRTPGLDVPALYLEHNTPAGDVPDTRHPMAGQSSVPIVHVTPFNQLFWDCGEAATCVIQHGIPDPGERYTGEIPRAAVVVNEPVRRGRSVGADIVAELARRVPVDLFGMRVTDLAEELAEQGLPARAYENLSQEEMHTELAHRRLYVHTPRWTSLGLSLLEAMYLAMPVVALATTETVLAVPPEAGVRTTSVDVLLAETERLLGEPELCRELGRQARKSARERYGLQRFLCEWDQLLDKYAG